MLPPTESEFNRQIYILASVCHIKEHASRPPPQCNSVEQKHLRLLDYIALLLMTKSRGDVAAVTMEHTATSLNFYFAKNRPCDFLTLSFVDRILMVLKEQPLRFMHKSMLMIVMVECVEKVSARIRKSQKAIKEAGEINIAHSLPSINHAKILESWEGLDDLQIVSSFLIELETFNTTTPIMRLNPETSMLLCIKAFLIENGKLLADYPTLHRRFQKMGSYCWRFKNYFKFPRTINCCQLSHLQRSHHRFTKLYKSQKSICTLLNEDAEKQDQEHVTDEDVKTKYPDIIVETTDNATVTTSDHCELTLALNAIKSGLTLALIKIGVSKRICWLCQQYLDFLSESKRARILISEYQGKIHSGWRVPECTPEDVKIKMHTLIHEEITEIREQIISRKKSDSFPPEDQLIEPIVEDPDMVRRFHDFF